jgi:hypothetical protein
MILMLLVFPYDTPVALKQARNWDGLTLIMTRMYKKDQVQSRIQAMGEENQKKETTTYKETCCDPVIR